MVEKKQITTTVLLTVLALSFLVVSFPQTSAQTTLNTYVLPIDAPTPWFMDYEGGAKHVVWYAGSKMGVEGYVVKVDCEKMVMGQSGSVHWWNITPSTNPEGSAYMVTVGISLGGGYVWLASAYSGADWFSDLLTRFDPLTNDVKNYWLTGVRSVRGLRCVGSDVWIAGTYWDVDKLKGASIQFDMTSEKWVWYNVEKAPYDLLYDGAYLWFSTWQFISKLDLVKGVIESKYYPSSPPNFLARDESGNIWFSMNNNQKICKLNVVSGTITEYDIGIAPSTDGPYGLSFDNSGHLWIAGYYALKMIEFDPSTGKVVKDYATNNRPYCSVKDKNGDVWCWSQGSVEMNYVDVVPLPEVKTFLTVTVPSSVWARAKITVKGKLCGTYSPSYSLVGGVAYAPLHVSTSWGFSADITTSATGDYQVILYAPSKSGTYTITITFAGDEHFVSCKISKTIKVGGWGW